MNRLFFYTVLPLTLLLCWEILSRSGVLDYRFYPAPSSIFSYLIFDSINDNILHDISASLFRVFWGLLIGASLGLCAGIAMGLIPIVKRLCFPLVAISYPIPKIAILPLIMLIFGLGELSKIVVVAIGAFFLVLMNTLQGVESINKQYFDIARVFSFSRKDVIFKIVLPGAGPAILTGLRLAVGYSLVIVVAAEFSGADAGIGYIIWQSWETFSIKTMYAGIFIISALGFTFAILLDLIEKVFLNWKEKNTR